MIKLQGVDTLTREMAELRDANALLQLRVQDETLRGEIAKLRLQFECNVREHEARLRAEARVAELEAALQAAEERAAAEVSARMPTSPISFQARLSMSRRGRAAEVHASKRGPTPASPSRFPLSFSRSVSSSL